MQQVELSISVTMDQPEFGVAVNKVKSARVPIWHCPIDAPRC